MQENTYGDFKKLLVWQRSRELVVRIYYITQKFPSEERFGLSSQLRRAAVSVPSNIAEGQRRASNKEFVQFLIIARGSLAEIETQLLIAQDLQYIPEKESIQFTNEIIEIGRILNGLIKSLQ